MDSSSGFGSPSTAGHGIDTESRLHAQGSWERDEHLPAYCVATAASPLTCPHSSSVEGPICWDCAEAGHVLQTDDFSHLRREGLRRQRELYERGKYDSWTASNDSTLGTPSTLPEWHPPEPGLEAVYLSMFARGAQSEAPEWLPPEQGIEVVQPDNTEKIPVPQKRGMFQRMFKFRDQKTHNQKICGLRRRTFYWILACAILLIVAIVLGVVLGLKLRHQDASPSPTSPQSTATAASSAGPTPTLSGMPSCPSANGTTYTDPTTKVDFKRECGLSHDGSDLSHHTAYSMDDCVASCAQTSLCMGAVWIAAGTQGTDNNYCWMHTDMSQEEYIRINQYAQSATRVVDT